jgi:ribosomal protein S12 methylthiotransferase RimO
MSKTLHVVSLGCTKNLIDTEVMMGKLQEYELTQDETQADVIIVNTCGFIDAAKEESINTILTLHETRKEASVLVMAGCLSERYKDELHAQLPEIDIFTGVGDYDLIDKLLEEKRSQFSDKVFLINDDIDRVITGSTYHAYIKLSEGCNQACSFCAIPSFKGKLNSRLIDSVVNEVKSLVERGYFDFSFVSQDSSSYLRDHGDKEGLEKLIDAIDAIEGVKSARILYLYPSTTTLKMLQKISDSKLFHNYYDMPIQHINNDMLRIMKRGFGKEKTIEELDYMKNIPDSFIRTSFIVGHPGESDEMFEEMCEFASSFGFDRINVFAYSNEETTAAYDMEQIDDEVIEKRAQILGDIASEITIKSMKQEIGKEVDIVIDGESDEHEFLLSARKLQWAPEVDGEIYVNDRTNDEVEIEFGKVYKAKITGIVGEILTATVYNES